MNKQTKKLIILVLLVVVWGAFLFLYQYKDIIFPKNEALIEDKISPVEEIKEPTQIAKERNDDFLLVYEDQESTDDKEDVLPIQVEEIEEERCGEFKCHSSQDFLDIYDAFEDTVHLPRLAKYVYDNKTVDDYLIDIAESLGYQKRVFAHESDIIKFEGIQTRKEVKDAYVAMRDEMIREGIHLHFVSGYRGSVAQRGIFQRKVAIENIEHIPTGLYDPQVYKTLAISALPGYSKHHSGYAADFGCGSEYLVYSFASTPCYEWMSENNFENAKRFGFIPSYPEGVESQGPNPEPWEFVWVGVENLK